MKSCFFCLGFLLLGVIVGMVSMHIWSGPYKNVMVHSMILEVEAGLRRMEAYSYSSMTTRMQVLKSLSSIKLELSSYTT
jgi:hypothetical protein